MKSIMCPQDLISLWEDHAIFGEQWNLDPFQCLAKLIDSVCSASDRGIVLIIDEVDHASNNEVLLTFLGTLRENYLARQDGLEASFQSVILAGITDIRNMKDKIRPNDKHEPNSPWNIAADFTVDMSFSAEETAGMLREYEADHLTGMDISAVSQEIRRLTSGYPYLVSWLCMWLDTEGRGNWTVDGVQMAGKAFLKSQCTLLGSIRGNLENHPDLKDALTRILFFGGEYSFDPPQPKIELGLMYGILTEGKKNRVRISNPLFKEYLSKYIVDFVRDKYMESGRNCNRADFLIGNRLNMVHVLDRFQAFLSREHRDKDSRFIEREGRLLFLGFLDPIINGTGHTYVEAETQDQKRMDVVVSYGAEEHIVELKIWDGKEYRKDGIQQLEGYMESREAQIGYLISFSFQKTDRGRRGWLPPEESEKQIYEVVIQLNHEKEQTDG